MVSGKQFITKFCKQCGAEFTVQRYKRVSRMVVFIAGWQSRKYCDMCSPQRKMINQRSRRPYNHQYARVHVDHRRENYKRWYSKPENKAKKKAYMQVYNAKPENRARNNARNLKRYHKKCELQKTIIENVPSAVKYGDMITPTNVEKC